MCEASEVEVGERMLIWCEGGPAMCRAVSYPPPLEVEVGDGIYVLVDEGAVDQWHYEFVTG